MRLNDLSFVLLRRVWCEHPPSRITQGTSKRHSRAATPSWSKQAAKRGHLPGRRGVALSRFIRQIITFAERVGPLHSASFLLFFFFFNVGSFQLCRIIGFYCTYVCLKLDVWGVCVAVNAIQNTTPPISEGDLIYRRRVCLFRNHTQSQYSPADKSTIIQPSQWQRFRVHGRRRGPPRSPSSSGDLTPPLRTLIDYLQAQHGGPHRLSSFLFPLDTLHSFIINKSFFPLHDSRSPPGRPLRSQAAGVLCCVR